MIDVRFKRIICMLLVISMMLTMPGCATIDGRPASFFEVVFDLVGGIIQAVALVVGELVLFVIFFAIDLVMSGIEKAVGGGDWWVVEDVGGPIMRGYARLIDPKGRFIGSEPEENTQTAPETVPETMPETVPKTVPETEGGIPQTDVKDGSVPEEKWGRYIIRFEPNGGSVQTTDGGVLIDQEVWKHTLLPWWPDPPKVNDKEPIRWGYRFIGWGTTPDALVIAYAPKMRLTGMNQSMTLYAMWAECTDHEYIVNEVEDNKILCKDCHTPIPMSELKFSVFLKYYYPDETLEEMKPDKKQEALNRYILTKTLMTRDELNQVQNFVNWGEKEDRNAFEYLASAEEVCTKFLEDITLQNSKHFFLSFNSLVTLADEVQYAKKFGKAVKGLDNTGTFLSSIDFVTSAMAAREKAASYKIAKEKGVEYAYYQEEAFLELAGANAKSLSALAGFICNFCTCSLSAPEPNEDELIEEVLQQGRQQTLREIYFTLVYPVSNKACVNDALAARGMKGRFKEPYYYTQENIIAAMKEGPSAKDFSLIINDTLDRVSAVNGDKKKVQFALWYYYGWRLQYDYECFIQDIYNDLI